MTILTLSTSLTIYAQTSDRTYKSFSDTTFEIGDKILAPRIYFTIEGGSRVLPEHYDSVKVIADFLTHQPNIDIEIGVHTDSRGSENYNLKFSEYRAKKVKHELVDRFGISPDRILVKGYGESDPIVTEDEIQQAETNEKKEDLYAKNRRIEIKIIKQ